MFNILEARIYNTGSFCRKFAPVKLQKPSSRRRLYIKYFSIAGMELESNETVKLFKHNYISYAVKYFKGENLKWLTVIRLPD